MTEQRTISSYVVGFILSLLLTMAAYFLVIDHLLVGNILLAVILILASIQLYVQLVFFLHIGRGKSAVWKMTVFLFTAIMIWTIVGGSIWIMNHLNYNMTPAEIQQYLTDQSGF